MYGSILWLYSDKYILQSEKSKRDGSPGFDRLNTCIPLTTVTTFIKQNYAIVNTDNG